MNVLTIVSHPRKDSLTSKVALEFIKGLEDAGHKVELFDLYQEEFDPLVREKDEPDWKSEKNIYSSVVHKEMERMNRNDALAFVFPVWWYNIPAMLKGYIDRVWNYNYAYGNSKLPHEKALWIGLAGGSKAHFAKRKYDKMIEHYLNIGLADYTGIPHSKVEILYDTLSEKALDPVQFGDFQKELLTKGYQLGTEFSRWE
ncbi:NAD(P)H oxidoreductase [Virgibacillus alimentarius]|uniref:NADPH-quinone reductase n=1 Tax=Virgibacillus alimentarius TaxID=698769 RepID=A0ABS4SBY6_9BACI|nr:MULTISPECIES: NAD(P)H oxidoreductase [Virgibacillus]MBP2259028.1 putative NADPH-quinone reductase [Virgibacillus alimentarius]HLR68248.1 NAD(P)H oxidoreductase [Virgibacillus sp.]